MKGKIILRPRSGLCNRLRAIGSAIRLARETNSELVVEWFRCPIRRWVANCGMRVRFSELFRPIDGVPVREKLVFRNDFPWNARCYSTRNANFYDESFRAQFTKDVLTDPCKTRWLQTYCPFYSVPDFSWVKPIPAIQDRIDSFVEKMGRNCIGVHVRRTDNAAAIKGSPLSLFIEKIDSEIKLDPQMRFFVSSDDILAKNELRMLFGDRILFCTEVSPRYTLKGEQDAVVDLMLLSRTRKMYGSYWSSFSEVASQIGGIPLETLVLTGVDLPKWARS